MSTQEDKLALIAGLNPAAVVEDQAEAGHPEKGSVSVEVDWNVRALARAAFYVARHKREVKSFAAFVEGALVREIKRVQDELNDGQPLIPEAEPLPAGRPI